MTSPSPTPPHQDPVSHSDMSKVTMMEYTTTLISTLDRRFDTLHQDLKDSINERFRAAEKAADDADRRYEQRYDAQQTALRDALLSADKAVQAALISAERAVAKAETASEKRFDAVNEFRAQLADQATTFMSRVEVEARLGALTEKVDDLKQFRDTTQGRSTGTTLSIGWIISGLGALATVVVVVNVIIALATK